MNVLMWGVIEFRVLQNVSIAADEGWLVFFSREKKNQSYAVLQGHTDTGRECFSF